MIRIFGGYDQREAIGWHVCEQSLIARSSEAFTLTPLEGEQRDGSNAFTYARFLVPSLCDFKGWALFMDFSDMMLRGDVAELWKLRDETKAVQVVMHDYRTKHPRKYIGTRMASDNEDYPCKNWSSLMLINCEHPANAVLRPSLVSGRTGAFLHRFAWLREEEVGALPPEWNHLVREFQPNQQAKLAHFTLGIPGFIYYSDDEFADEWKSYALRALSGTQYEIKQLKEAA